ncbi:interleukin-13 receptor subunit alpha-2 isoform X2 [Melanotaenia boesemani]|uniref:interleukin-13 receptor subunit alpha-2 isoform X2 n=1 Tax=Melanotaenia boesemani TaxID=1250792 RepID=UPI001C04AC06|nr:interleukin-13 receptor subunit alpha-2 isoform X2 [Melanotaenia boesemani]
MLIMANKFRLIYPSLQMLLFMILKESNGLSVDPPENLAVLDPGHLGLLEITWSPPSNLINVTDCSAMYQLEYYNTYKDRWAAVRTEKATYRAQFNLMKDVHVRVYTLLNGPCTNNTMIKSTNYSELFQNSPSTGIKDTAVQDFICIFQNMEYLECKWKRSPKMPANSEQSLYFWHKPLEQAVECPKYIKSGEVRTGCNFTGKSLPQFTDINFSVNGSSPKGPLMPFFITLQIQNHVKPAATEKLYLQTGLDNQLELHWEDPVGKVPTQCLEWEVEHSQEGADGKLSLRNIPADQNSLTLSSSHSDESSCFRVRSKLHKYCVEQSFWSDWSHPVCHPAPDNVIT